MHPVFEEAGGLSRSNNLMFTRYHSGKRDLFLGFFSFVFRATFGILASDTITKYV